MSNPQKEKEKEKGVWERPQMRFEVFDDTIKNLDHLGDSIESLVEWIEGGGMTSSEPERLDKEQIKSVNILLRNIEEALNVKYRRFEELLDRLLLSLRFTTDLNLVRTDEQGNSTDSDKIEKCGETDSNKTGKCEENVLDIENIIITMCKIWDVRSTLENIYKYLICDSAERELLDKTEVNLNDYNKSIEGMFSLSDMIVDIIKASQDKLEDIRSVFA